jgi:23S rRNA pseudouridine2605 synthase
MEERLQKVMARAGVGSRRQCEELICQGRVTVNGEVAQLGAKADPVRDEIFLDGERLGSPEAPVYIMVHKPVWVISDEDVSGRHRAVRDMVPVPGHLYTVGRLDLRSEGLILLTNDGELTNKLTHPRYEHPKTYHVLVSGMPSEDVLAAWRRGVILEGQKTAPAQVRILRKEGRDTWLEITLREGRKRQIREMTALLGHQGQRVIRVKLGPLELGDLQPGAWRHLKPEEVRALAQVRESPRRRRK